MKARAVEHVRWRSIKALDDIESKAVISRMHGFAYERALGHQELSDTWKMFQDRPAPGSDSIAPLATPPHSFIMDAQQRSLWVTTLKHTDQKVSMHFQRARPCQRSKAELDLTGLSQAREQADECRLCHI